MDEKIVREHLRKLLLWHDAHLDWKAALSGFPAEQRGLKPEGAPHTAWELLEHVRIAQWDILEFCRDPMHVSPDWPAGYWPKSPAPHNSVSWEVSLKSFQHDTEEMGRLVTDPKTDITAPIPHGSGQTILREALLLADHNSYHLGQVILLRRLLGSWSET
jgi:hypothetical protein